MTLKSPPPRCSANATSWLSLSGKGCSKTSHPSIIDSRLSPPERGSTCRRRAAINGSPDRSEEHTSELQSLMRISYAVFCLKKKTKNEYISTTTTDTKRICKTLHE